MGRSVRAVAIAAAMLISFPAAAFADTGSGGPGVTTTAVCPGAAPGAGSAGGAAAPGAGAAAGTGGAGSGKPGTAGTSATPGDTGPGSGSSAGAAGTGDAAGTPQAAGPDDGSGGDGPGDHGSDGRGSGGDGSGHGGSGDGGSGDQGGTGQGGDDHGGSGQGGDGQGGDDHGGSGQGDDGQGGSGQNSGDQDGTGQGGDSQGGDKQGDGGQGGGDQGSGDQGSGDQGGNGSGSGDDPTGDAGAGDAGAGDTPTDAPAPTGDAGPGDAPPAASPADSPANPAPAPSDCATTGAPAYPGAATSAAVAHGWGEPTKVDDFDGTSLQGWSPYDGPGHAGKGTRSPGAISVGNGLLTIAGDADGITGGMAWSDGSQKYGRWEGRVRAPASDPSYNALLLLWPTAENFPVGGEIDFMEMTDHTRQKTNMFLHYGEDNNQVHGEVEIDATQWHNWAVEWTPKGVTAFVDGRQWWHTDDTSVLPPGPMHLTIQLDWFPKGGGGVKPSEMQVDWVRQYALPESEKGGGGGNDEGLLDGLVHRVTGLTEGGPDRGPGSATRGPSGS